jgi:hypothetical protein
MRKFLVTLALILTVLSTQAQVNKKVTTIKGIRTAITPRLSKWKPDFTDPVLNIKTRDEKGLIFARDLQPLSFTDFGSSHKGPDPVLQKGNSNGLKQDNPLLVASPLNADFQREGGTINNNFDGIGFSNVSPADPTLAVGPNHLIQMVNGQNGSAYFRIYDKNGGTLSFQAFMDQLPGSSYNGAGDCITWYDQFTDRFVMSEFGDSAKTGTSVNSLIMAVSQTNDPLGAWYVYEFSDASFFPDYPKYGNWVNAWYGMTRDFVGSYAGNSIWAFDKMKMIAGDPNPSVQRIRFSDADNKYNSMCPVSVIGTTPPPPGTPGLFLYYNDDNYTSSPADRDSLGIIGFTVDFANPANSQASVIQSLPVAAFKSNVCNSRNCAPTAQGIGYDVISSRIMNKPYYRNFGTHEAIVANHTVDATGSGVSGLRWYELRKTSTDWATYQVGTFAPQSIIPCINTAQVHRFMGAITLNSKGQVAMAYNNTSATSYGSISFTGRNDNDPLNIMSYEEASGFNGTSYGTFGNRWGDYNDIVPDISNDSVFWFSGMYGSTGSWKTRILAFVLSPNLDLDAKMVAIESPNSCENSCSNIVAPIISFRNSGNTPLTSLNINYQVNGGPVSIAVWTGSLLISQQTSFTLPPTVFPGGNSTFTVFISNANGNAMDNVTANDTISTAVNIGTGTDLPITQDFENIIFPPLGWIRSTNSTPVFNWERTTNAAHTGTASIFIDNFDQNQPGKSSDIKTPVINAAGLDSLSLSFWIAAASFDLDNMDTLEVLVSSDCGNSFQSAWKKWGTDINTRPGFVTTPFVPTANEWKEIRISLNDFLGSGKIIVAFRNINGFGNNIYIDDINLIGAVLPLTDASVYVIKDPSDFICNSLLIPNISLVNLGKDTLRTVNINYSIDSGTLKTFNWTGALARKEGTTVLHEGQNVSAGNHLITVFSSAPNGTIDQETSNDTLINEFQVKLPVNAPVVQEFEGLDFLPDQWNTQSPVDSSRWRKSSNSSYNGVSSLLARNYNRPATIPNIIISPMVRYKDVDSVFISFQLASATRYPWTNIIPVDTLEILVSEDCGVNFTSVYKKWGMDLQTINDANTPAPVPFAPRDKEDWRKEILNVTTVLGKTNDFVVAFRNFSNGDNNIYIDDVNIYTKTLAPKLKKNGYLISPNPFTSRFILQHFPNADDLKGINVYTSSGQLVFKKSWAMGTADSYVEINLNSLPSGLYIVQMHYADRVVTEKVIKGN